MPAPALFSLMYFSISTTKGRERILRGILLTSVNTSSSLSIAGLVTRKKPNSLSMFFSAVW